MKVRVFTFMLKDWFSRFKLFIIVLLPALVITGLVLFLTRNEAIRDLEVKQPKSASKEVPLISSNNSVLQDSSNDNKDLENRVKDLEEAVIALNRKINAYSSTSPLTPTTGVNFAPTPTSPPVVSVAPPVSTQTSSAKSVYIPVGYSGSSTATQDFESIGSQQVTIDTSNYPGYKQVVLEANMRIYQGNGTGWARLYNLTDGAIISGSDVSTSSETFSTKSSSGFTLPAGNKLYTVQLKSLTGYSVDLQLVRIRIDF
jgi:hypothetical protein